MRFPGEPRTMMNQNAGKLSHVLRYLIGWMYLNGVRFPAKIRCVRQSVRLFPPKKQDKLHTTDIQCFLMISVREQEWHTDESARLPPMWPGFDSGPGPFVGWVCCWFSPCSEGFSPGSPVFLPPNKPTFPNSNSTLIEDLHENQVRLICLPL